MQKESILAYTWSLLQNRYSTMVKDRKAQAQTGVCVRVCMCVCAREAHQQLKLIRTVNYLHHSVNICNEYIVIITGTRLPACQCLHCLGVPRCLTIQSDSAVHCCQMTEQEWLTFGPTAASIESENVCFTAEEKAENPIR